MQNNQFVPNINGQFSFQPLVQTTSMMSTVPQGQFTLPVPGSIPPLQQPTYQLPVPQPAYQPIQLPVPQPTYQLPQPLYQSSLQLPATASIAPLQQPTYQLPVSGSIPPIQQPFQQPMIQLPVGLQSQMNPFGLPTNIPPISTQTSTQPAIQLTPDVVTTESTNSIQKFKNFVEGDNMSYDFATGEMVYSNPSSTGSIKVTPEEDREYVYDDDEQHDGYDGKTYNNGDESTRIYPGMIHQKLHIEPGRPVLLDAQTKLMIKDQVDNHVLYPIRCGTCTRFINVQAQNLDKELLELANSSATEYPENIIGMIMDKQKLFNSCCRTKILEAYKTKNSFVDPLSYANLPGQGDTFSRFSKFTLLPEESLNIRTIEGAKDDFSTVLALPEGKAPSEIPLLGRDVKYEDINKHIEYNCRQKADTSEVTALPSSFNLNACIPPVAGAPMIGTGISLPNNMVPGLCNMTLPPIGGQSSLGGLSNLNTQFNFGRPELQGLQLAPLMPAGTGPVTGPGLPTLQRLRTMPTNLTTIRAKRVRAYDCR